MTSLNVSTTSPLQATNHAAFLLDARYLIEILEDIADVAVRYNEAPTEEQLITRCDTAAILAEEALDVFMGMLE